MLLIGSRAAGMHYPNLWDAPNDVDIVAEFSEINELVNRLGIPMCPIGKSKMIGQLASGTMLEVDIAWPGNTSYDLLQKVNKDNRVTVLELGCDVALPSMDWLFTIKSSHRYKKNDPHFAKTLRDYHLMKYKLGCKITDENWLKAREKETYIKRRPRLNSSKKEFFSDSSLKYKYDHDTLHIAVSHLEQPAYEYYKADDAEVMCSRKKWNSCSDEIKLYGVLEESYVLALERSQIPYGKNISPRDSFNIALSKVCTSITSGFFREFAYENYYRVLDLYSDEYVTMFENALQKGIVKEYQ